MNKNRVPIIGGAVIAVCILAIILLANRSPAPHSDAKGNGTASVITGGILLPRGVPLATSSRDDVDLWLQASPTTINGQPVSSGDSGGQSLLLQTGRVILLSSGQRVTSFQTEGRKTYVKAEGFTEGWVPSFCVVPSGSSGTRFGP